MEKIYPFSLDSRDFSTRITIQPKFSVQPVEMQMVRENLTEIFRKKRTTLGGTPHFSLEPVGTEITVPFGQNFHLCCSCCKLVSIITMHCGLNIILRSV